MCIMCFIPIARENCEQQYYQRLCTPDSTTWKKTAHSLKYFIRLCIRGAFHNNFPGFSGFGLCRKLARTKTQQGTEKASKNNRCLYSIFTGFGLLHSSTEVASTLFYHVSSRSFNSSQFAPTPFLASVSTSASDITRCRHSLSRVCSDGCCITTPPYIGRCRRTGMAAPYRYLPPLPCWPKLSETAKKLCCLRREVRIPDLLLL